MEKTAAVTACLLWLLLLLVFSTPASSTSTSLFPQAEATENSWTTKTSMPQAISGVKAAVVNGKIYAIGGKVNFEYNPDTDTWITKKPMPTERKYFGIAVYKNKIYAIGGRNWINGVNICYSVNEVYDPSTDTWETKEPMPTNRSDLDANVVNGKIHLIGGSITGSHEVYDIATDSWTTKEQIPYPVIGYASAVVDNKIYIIGGSINQTQIYDPRIDSWNLGAPIPTAVLNAAAGATTGIMAPKRIYVIGGNQGIEGTNITQVYNPENEIWTFGAPMPTARGGLTVAVVNDMLYAIAGRPCSICPPFKTNEQYTPFGYGTIPQPFLITLIVAAIAITAIGVAAPLVYFRKIKKTTGKPE